MGLDAQCNEGISLVLGMLVFVLCLICVPYIVAFKLDR